MTPNGLTTTDIYGEMAPHRRQRGSAAADAPRHRAAPGGLAAGRLEGQGQGGREMMTR
jgi:hypothetical protein